MSVSTSGGNQSVFGARSYAEAMSVTECATVNPVTIGTSARKRRNGTTRQSRKSRWSTPSRMCSKPETTKFQAAWCQRGSRVTTPGSPRSSNARSAPAGVRNRITETTRSPRRSTPGRMENADSADAVS